MALSVSTIGSLGNAKTGTTFAPGVPSGVASGSLVVAAVMGYATTLTTAPTITGFTAGPVSASALNAFGFQFKVWWFYKYATGADTGSYAGTMASGNAMMAFAFTLAGWTPTSGSPFVDSLHEAVTNGGAATVTSFTPAASGTLLTAIHLDSGANFPAGWTKSANATDLDGDSITVSYLYQTTAAATGSIVFGNIDGTVVSVASIRLPAGGAAITASGGITLSGSAALKGALAASGGITLAGSAALKGALAAAGTITLGGSAVLGGGVQAAGGITLAGSAALKGALAAGGGITLSGSAVLGAPSGAITAAGGITLGGSAALKGALAAGGGITLGGQAVLSTLSKVVAGGGITLGGSALLRGALTAAGTITLGGMAQLYAGGSGVEMDEGQFWAQASGLTPLRNYSVEEHQLAAMRARRSLTTGSLDDVAPLYYAGLGYTGTVDEMEHAFWAHLAGLSATVAYSATQPDVKTQALALGPLVP